MPVLLFLPPLDLSISDTDSSLGIVMHEVLVLCSLPPPNNGINKNQDRLLMMGPLLGTRHVPFWHSWSPFPPRYHTPSCSPPHWLLPGSPLPVLSLSLPSWGWSTQDSIPDPLFFSIHSPCLVVSSKLTALSTSIS